MLDANVSSLAIDYHRNASQPECFCLHIDLSTDEGWQQLDDLSSVYTIVLFFAPPCGTASRAREIPLNSDLLEQGLTEPIPLRSEEFPDGLPDLSGTNLVRLNSANSIYRHLAEFVTRAVNRGKFFVIENPARSLFWQTSWIKPLFSLPGSLMVLYDACMFGGTRPKHQLLLTNIQSLSQMSLLCDGSHTHEPWSVKRKIDGDWKFDTASEAAYPVKFCKVLSLLLADWIKQQGSFTALPQQVRPRKVLSEQLQISLKQPRGHKSATLFPEYCDYETVAFQHETQMQQFVKANPDKKLLETRTGHNADGVDEAVPVTGVVGIFGHMWSKQEFLENALTVEHPYRAARSKQDASLRAIFNILTLGHSKCVFNLKSKLALMKLKLQSLAEKEKQLHAAMTKDVAKVLEGKNILLFKHLLERIQHPDKELAGDMAAGFKITGRLEPTGLFDLENKPATISREELWALAPAIKRVTTTIGTSRDPELDEKVFEETLKEVQEGWLFPTSETELNQKFSSCWIPVRRFGVVQGDKVRPVDNFKTARINEALEQTEKLSLDSVDDYVSIARCWLDATSTENLVSLTLSTGEVLSGKLHPEWSGLDFKILQGKTFDLTAAYKQLARSPADAMFTTIAVMCPRTSKINFFESTALPFGATGSVVAFLRTSRALKDVLTGWLEIPCISFFDDFPIVSCACLTEAFDEAFREFMSLLGWRISTSAKKDIRFDKCFEPLGVMISFPNPSEVIVSNKPSRVANVKAFIEETISSGYISSKQSASLRGKLTFMEGQHLNKTLSLAMRTISKLADSSQTKMKLDDVAVEELLLAHKCLSLSKPRIVPASWPEGEVLVFTDGAHEPGTPRDLVTCGGMIVVESLGVRQFFRLVIPDLIVDKWMSTGKKQCIGQAEILPVLISKIVWKQFLNNRLAIYFVDNESAKATLINRYSPVLDSSRIIWAISVVDCELQCRDWYARVPSFSNPSDEPSRLMKPLPELGLFVEVEVDPLDDDILAIILGENEM